MNRMLKKITKLSGLIMMSLMFSFCSKESALENSDAQPNEGNIVLPNLTATFSPMQKAGQDTKITTTPDGKVSWDANDNLTVFIADTKEPLPEYNYWKCRHKYVTSESTYKQNLFHLDPDPENEVKLTAGKTYDWNIMSPYSSSIRHINPSVGNPGNYDMSKQTIELDQPMAHLTKYDIMTAQALNVPAEATPTFTLEHKCALMKFTFTNTDAAEMNIDEIKFTAPEGSYIGGKFKIDFAPGKPLQVVSSSQTKNSNTVLFTKAGVKSALTLQPQEKFDVYVTMPAFTLAAESTFTIEATTNLGKLTRTSVAKSEIKFLAGTINTANIELKATHVESIAFDPANVQMKKGDSQKLVPVFTPVNPDNQNLTWESDNAEIVSVDASGNITAKAIGTAVIKATTEDGGKIANCTVNVIGLNKSQVVLAAAGTEKLSVVNLTPEAGTIEWTSSNQAVATIDAEGNINAIAEGYTEITGTLKPAAPVARAAADAAVVFTASVNVCPEGFVPTIINYKGIPIYIVKVAGDETMKDFYIGQFEVSQELWSAVMPENNSKFTGSSLLPAEKMPYGEALKFVETLSTETGYRISLPSVAQWEYAAKGGTKTQGFTYSGSNNIDDVAWYKTNSGSTTHKVGMKKANELGIFDMSGNVREWCTDTKPGSPSYNFVKGGCYDDNAECAAILYKEHTAGNNDYGYSYRIGIRFIITDFSTNTPDWGTGENDWFGK